MQNVNCCAVGPKGPTAYHRGVCVHEIGHALGLAHEQDSPDPNRILMLRQSKGQQSLNGDETDVGYDSTSYMHYADFRGGFREMNVGQLYSIPSSFYMMKELSLGIKCEELRCPDFNMTCENEGYVTTVDDKCACRCYDGLDPDTGCRAVMSSETSTQAWPGGSYALPSPVEGCADGDALPGEMSHFNDGGNKVSTEFSLKGGVDGQKITHSFCVTDQSTSEDVWPPGDYCIYRKGGKCPATFKESFVQFGKANRSAQDNAQSGTLPDGMFGNTTRLEYCCKGDYWSQEEIFLPNKKPFVLIKNGDSCQLVRGMNVYTQSYTIGNPVNGGADFKGTGEVPDTPLTSSSTVTEYTIEFCYYKPALLDCGGVHSLSADSPSVTFSSPAGSDRRCTWLIKVPDGERIKLEFSKFNISGSNRRGLGDVASGHGKYCNDKLDIRYFRPGQTGHIFCGDKLDRTIVSTNSTMVVHLIAKEAISEFTATATIVQNKDQCYNVADHGVSYAGNVNFTRFFQPCLPWTEAVKCQYNPFSVDAERNNVRLEGNFCRNPDYATGVMPWCYITGCDIGYCDPCLVAGDGGKAIAQGVSVTPIAEVACDEPPVVFDGIQINGPTSGPYEVGSNITYACFLPDEDRLAEGYNQTRTKTRVCLSDGQWSPLGYVCDVCPDGLTWQQSTGQCYRFINDPTSMTKGVEACKSMGMSMAMPKSEEDSKIIRSLTRHKIWIPASYEDKEETFRWNDGTLLGSKDVTGSWNWTSWANWAKNEPNNHRNNEDCVVMKNDGTWNDISCSKNMYAYVCVAAGLKQPHCLDFIDTCQALFTADPTICSKHDEFAQSICPATCGKCDAGHKACTVPTTPENAISVRGQSGTLKSGDIIEHKCNAGYKVESGDRFRACLADGTLTGSDIKCVQSCPTTRQEGWHWDEDSGKCYGFYKHAVPMQKAIDECKSIGMTIALPKTESVNTILRSLSRAKIWIPASDAEVEGSFKWNDGALLGSEDANGSWNGTSWTNWAKNQPDDWNNKEDCTMMRTNGEWNDVGCNYSFGYVCEGPIITPPELL